ncbi:MAG TPA: hypothetical protein VJP81_09190 [Candidatus Dormibacteraeota bacterium]|nr:hypothetical protein [Candidatus Dormibacteraeota bacterium]
MGVLLESLLVFSAARALYVVWRSIVVIGPAQVDVAPEALVTGGGGALEGLAASFMRSLTANGTDKEKADR